MFFLYLNELLWQQKNAAYVLRLYQNMAIIQDN
jgi:hypothetical protein